MQVASFNYPSSKNKSLQEYTLVSKHVVAKVSLLTNHPFASVLTQRQRSSHLPIHSNKQRPSQITTSPPSGHSSAHPTSHSRTPPSRPRLLRPMRPPQFSSTAPAPPPGSTPSSSSSSLATPTSSPPPLRVTTPSCTSSAPRSVLTTAHLTS